MDLRVRDVAALLNVSEQTVYRWVNDGVLRAHRLGDQLRFNRVELQEWAATHGHRVSPKLFASTDSNDLIPSLRDALERGGIYYDVPGDRREKVLASVARLPGIPAGVDRALLQQLLIARETLASTAVGNGIAVPHPRDPLVVRVEDPIALLCFLQRQVDFGALDGQPVHVLLVLLSPSVRLHLQLLAKLAYVLNDNRMKRLLHDGVPTKQDLLDQIRRIEESTGPATPGSGPISQRSPLH
jgi:PTS system nitrogen regulatory IIA component